MNVDLFLKRHSQQWAELRRDPMWDDLVELLRSFDPARAMDSITAMDGTNNSSFLLGRIAGFALCMNAFTGIEIPSDNSTPEQNYEQQDA